MNYGPHISCTALIMTLVGYKTLIVISYLVDSCPDLIIQPLTVFVVVHVEVQSGRVKWGTKLEVEAGEVRDRDRCGDGDGSGHCGGKEVKHTLKQGEDGYFGLRASLYRLKAKHIRFRKHT